MTLTATDFADLVSSTLNELGPYDAYQQIAQTKQRFEVLSRWFKQDKMTLDAGVAIQRQLMVADTGAAEHNEVTAEDNVNLADILKSITVPWRHALTKWMVVRQHVLMNRKPAAILNNIKAQRNGAMLSLHDEMENKAWAAAPSASNKTDPWAVQYWIVKNATTGFYGQSPTADNLIAGLNLAQLPNTQAFNNYSGTYGANTPSDLLTKMRDMHHYTNFVSPIDQTDYTTGAGDSYRVYANRNTVRGFEDIAMSQADLSLRDIQSVDGWNLNFHGNPIRTITALDSATDDPVYFICHDVFKPVALEGDYLEETRNMAPKNHNIEQYFVDLSYNFLCVDRRRNGVIYKV